MSPAYATAEQYERWYKKTCVRCGRFGCFAATWPDGHVCRTCHDRALKVHGRCPGCHVERVLPGIRTSDQTPICAECAGFTVSYRCARCRHEGKIHARHLCTRCTFSDELTSLLSAGTGTIRPELVPLAAHLLAMNNPLTGLTWLHPRKGRDRTPADLLAELGRGEIELTHTAFHTLQPWRAAAHLAGTADGLRGAASRRQADLPVRAMADRARGRHNRRGARQADPAVRHLGCAASASRAGRAQPTHREQPPGLRRPSQQATQFLGWLAAHGRTLDDCGQADIDAWHVEHGTHARTHLRGFLHWCAANKLTRRFRLPTTVMPPATPIPQRERVDLIGRLLTETDQPLRSRVAATIVLLYAQPVSRIVRLTTDDVIHEGDQILLRVGEPPSPVPGPVAELLLTWIGQRTNMNTATNRDSRWLFPGRRAGQPMHPATLSALITALGVPNVAGRVAAMHQHVLEMPAPVVADALSYHHVTTTRVAAQVTADWTRYATGPRLRTPSGWEPRTRDS